MNPHEVQLPTAEAMRIYMNRGGADARSGSLLHGKFRALGLAEIAAEGRMLMFDRANGGAEIMRVNFEQVRARLIASGLIDKEQLRADLARLDDADFAVPSPIMWSVVADAPLAIPRQRRSRLNDHATPLATMVRPAQAGASNEGSPAKGSLVGVKGFEPSTPTSRIFLRLVQGSPRTSETS